MLAAQEIVKLVKRLAISEHKLGETIALIRSLDPVPGQTIEEGKSEYVIPDLFVAKVNGQWRVELNPDIAPRLRVNPFYSSMIKRTDTSKDNVSMKEHLQEARWFIKSLHSRNDTLLRVGAEYYPAADRVSRTWRYCHETNGIKRYCRGIGTA